jgi:phytoene/squalene synthetase
MRRQIERAREHYMLAAPLYEMIDPAGRRIYGLMWSRYRMLLERIAHRPAAVLQGRVRLPRSRKLALILRWTTFPPRRLPTMV